MPTDSSATGRLLPAVRATVLCRSNAPERLDCALDVPCSSAADIWTRTRAEPSASPKDQSRQFAVVAISLTVGVWIVLPLLGRLSLAG
jgi:hypothetical protein